jgi:NAD(P)-dependent dehydrogenase (short-subunit alcohol dehydrogenase family)
MLSPGAFLRPRVACLNASGTIARMDALRGKIAVVTGASRGIGRALARSLEREGCRLALASRSIDAAAFPRALAEPCDVRDPRSVDDFFSAVRQRFGHIDILVNNAGNAHAILNVEDMPVETFRDVLDTNLFGTFLCTRAALPLMASGSAIVNNLSICAVQVFPQESAYCAAKFGALGFTNVLREECRPRGIRVSALIAGATATDIWNQFMPDAPRDRMLTPDTVATAVVNALMLPENSSLDEIRISPTTGAL